MRQMTQAARKPSKAQARWITEAIDSDGTYRAGIPQRSRQILMDAGWLVERLNFAGGLHATPKSLDHVTDAARLAVGRAETIRLDVEPGTVLVYRTHPGCTFRVSEVVTDKYGQGFKGTYISVCHTCAHQGAGQRVGDNVHTDPAVGPQMVERAFNVRRETGLEVAARIDAELDAAAINQTSPQYRHFVDAVRIAKSYAGALDILHAEALTLDASRDRAANVGHAAWLYSQATARTGADGARTLIPTEAPQDAPWYDMRTAAEVAEGQVLAAVAQAGRAAGCPPLCDASAVLHIVPANLRDARPRPFDISPLRPSDVGDAWPTSGFAI